MADNSLRFKIQTEVLRVVDVGKTVTAAKEKAADFLAAHPEIDQQQLWDRVTFLLGSIDPWQREGAINSLAVNKRLVVKTTEAPPFFTVSTAGDEEAGQPA
jgi:hypothetical protein